MILLPDKTTRMWEQTNRSDVLGTLWSSFNLNLSEQLGKTKISPRMVITTNNVSSMGTPIAFREFSGALYAMCAPSAEANYGVFNTANPYCESPFVLNTGSGSGATNFSSNSSDLEIFNSKLYASGNDDAILYTSNGSSWTAISSILTSSVPHKMLNYPTTNRLYITSGYAQIISLDTTNTVASSGSNTFAVTNTDLVITSLIQNGTYIWILLLNQYNNQGFVYTWDGVTANTATAIYPLDSRGALAGIVKDGTVYIIDTDGKLMSHNGQAFIACPNGQLPIKLSKYLKNPISLNNNRWIHPNGITLVNGRINILINNENYDNGQTIQESLPSGIWEYVENGSSSFWYHKSTLTQYDYSSGSPTITDWGQNRIARVGALFNVKKDDNTSASVVGTLLAGADYFVDGSTSKSAVFTNDSLDTLQKYGYLVITKQLTTASVQNTWEKIFLRIRPLLNSTDKITIKYRSNDDTALETNITWLNYTTFTTTTNVSSYSPTSQQNVGGEVEITQGSGSGYCAHVKSVTNNSGTYTVVLDDNILNTGGATAKARFQTWNKLGDFTQQNLNLVSFGDMGAGTWIQVKVCFLFTGNNEMIDMLIQNGPYQ